MIGRVAGTTSSTALSGARTTFGSASSGSHRPTGSSMAIRPSSTSIMTAAAVIGLVTDAKRKIESLAIGSPSTAIERTAATSIRSPQTTRPTAPGTDPSLTYLPSTSCRPAIDPPSAGRDHSTDYRRGQNSSARRVNPQNTTRPPASRGAGAGGPHPPRAAAPIRGSAPSAEQEIWTPTPQQPANHAAAPSRRSARCQRRAH